MTKYIFTRYVARFRPGDVLPAEHEYEDHHVEGWKRKGLLVAEEAPEPAPKKATAKKKAASKK